MEPTHNEIKNDKSHVLEMREACYKGDMEYYFRR